MNPGTATVKIVGGNNYTGSRTTTFKIASAGSNPKVKATDKGNGQVGLAWDAIYNASAYMIQEKMPNGQMKTISDNWTLTKCTIANLSATRIHRFLVRALVDGTWSSDSDVNLVSIKPTGVTKPTLQITSASKTSLKLSWNSVPGTDRFAIYEKVGKKFKALTKSYTGTAATINKLKKKGKYTFYVRAKIDGKWSAKSNTVTMSPSDPNPPVVTASAGVGKGKVKLSWTKTRNAKKYMVQVKLANGKWKTLTKKCKKLYYTVKGLDPGHDYTFRVRAYGNKKWSKNYGNYYVTARPDNA